MCDAIDREQESLPIPSVYGVRSNTRARDRTREKMFSFVYLSVGWLVGWLPRTILSCSVSTNTLSQLLLGSLVCTFSHSVGLSHLTGGCRPFSVRVSILAVLFGVSAWR